MAGGKMALTLTIYALIPADDYDARLIEVISGIEYGLQQAEADYAPIVRRAGIPAEVSDTL